MKMTVAIVGATGLVGREMLKVLEERQFPIDDLILVASEKSKGQTLEFKSKQYQVITVDQALKYKIDIALFSAGGSFSKQYAKKFIESTGAYVIDNSSAWRMDPDVKLIVPEINGHLITEDDKLIANPNCSTIQMVVVLYPLHKQFRIRRIIVSTYQSVTGAGYKAVEQMIYERSGFEPKIMKFPTRIDLNVIPQCDIFLDNDYTKEELKMVNETHKILNDRSIKITATAVRVPVIGGHSESVYVEFEQDFEVEEVRQILREQDGIVVMDDPGALLYPTPYFVRGRDEVFVGRIRKDLFEPKALNLWIVADNLRKGAATNAVQIAEIIKTKFLNK